MNLNNPLLNIDFYKVDHRRQYPNNTTEVYSNFTPRSVILGNNLPKDFDNQILWVGLQASMIELEKTWGNWFKKSSTAREKDIQEYQYIIESSLGLEYFNTHHMYALSDLGYLPIEIKALPEGDLVPIGCPVLTIRNTHPDYAWLTNYLETYLSAQLWKTSTVATIALQYRKLFELYAEYTCDNNDHVLYQGHDFSYRGMSGTDDAARSGLGHLACFVGSDNVPAIVHTMKNYKGKSLVGSSVNATEHSVMCMGTKEGELATFERLLDLYPTGILSIVSDTWDLYNVLRNILPKLKDKILARDGKLVIRPDSGDPEKMIMSTLYSLRATFGCTRNKQGYDEINDKVGVIYGDSITFERAASILSTMQKENFASNNVVFGIGSYTYQYLTRDTFGWAMKATSGVVDGKRIDIFKDPITDDGKKRSLRGLIKVLKYIDDRYFSVDEISEDTETGGCLRTVFKNGKIVTRTSLDVIRKKVNSHA